MSLPYKPKAVIEIDGENIADKLAMVAYSLTVDDNIGYDNDRLSLSISSNLYIPVIDKDSRIKVTLGYADDAIGVLTRFMGEFTLSEYNINISREGFRTLDIVGSAIEYGVSSLDSHRTRTWTDVTFREIVSTIANSHGLSFEIQSNLSGESFSHEVQDTSDQIFLSNICKRFDAYIKVFANRIYIYQRGEQVNDNKVNPEIVLYGSLGTKDNSIISANYGKTFKKSYSGIEVQYKSGESVETIARGDTSDTKHTLKLPYVYDNATLANQVARAKIAQLGRLTEVITFDTVGDPNLQSGATLVISEFDSAFDGKYFIDSCVHKFSGAYTCQLTCTLIDEKKTVLIN